jgi:hypothetical protein
MMANGYHLFQHSMLRELRSLWLTSMNLGKIHMTEIKRAGVESSNALRAWENDGEWIGRIECDVGKYFYLVGWD